MSLEAIVWAFQQKTNNAAEKATLLAIANYANPKQGSHPSKALLAAMTDQDQRTVARKIRSLEEQGLVVVEKRSRGNGSQTSNIYRLPVDTPVPGPKTGRTASADADTAEPTGGDGNAPQQAPGPPPEAPARKKPRRRLPESWQPSESHHEKATRLGSDINDEADKFRAHAKTHDRMVVDWDMAFHTWLSKGAEFRKSQKNGKGGKGQGTAKKVDRFDVDVSF